jgi:type III restriction enzyme
MEQRLDTILESLKLAFGKDYYKKRVPNFVCDNLRSGFGKREYQQESFGRFDFYWSQYENRHKGIPTQLLFHMATGSGKTLVMAGLILYLYEKGYRNFLFFVNNSNIIEKTRENFLNPNSSKYLFAESISICDKKIHIKEVDNFQASNQDDVNIVFSTIQGLHSRLNTPRENSVTYDDFEDQKIVLISDEAHHINAETKRGETQTNEELFEIVSWEQTVFKIFRANKENVLLEFTATMDFSDPNIAEKYSDKVVFDYPLKQYRIDGYSKEVKVLQADLSPFERALQGVVLSQYRRKIFEKNKKKVKPVILFKSKTIKESHVFYDVFVNGIKQLTISNLEKIKSNTVKYSEYQKSLFGEDSGKSLFDAFKYFEQNNISLDNLISELREDFAEEKLISVNSKDESEQKQLAVNSLEDEKNEYRAVFAVDKLNEGWDVLNLFDIVRLYDTRDAKDGKPGKTTMSEAQLIGRGARYYPFRVADAQPLYQRKYDADLENELRVCEELYYHSAYNPRYIQELNIALKEIGIKPKETKEREVRLKEEFKSTALYKAGILFLNELKLNTREDVTSLSSTIQQKLYKVKLRTGFTKLSIIFVDTEKELLERKSKDYQLVEFGEHVLRTALNRIEFFRFCNLKKYLPQLHSIKEFIRSKNYLLPIKVEVSGLASDVEDLSQQQKLECTLEVLNDIALNLPDKIEYKGTKHFTPYLFKDKIKDKKLTFSIEGSDVKETGKSMVQESLAEYQLDVRAKAWYIFNDNYGSSEEKSFIKYVNKVYDVLKSKYDEIYLVRNERYFKLYNFDDGSALEPDFVLFLSKKEPAINVHYQIFIEPKGGYLLKTDEWKEIFLQRLKDEHIIEQLWSGNHYAIWGMPFYNEQERMNEFEEAFNKVLSV